MISPKSKFKFLDRGFRNTLLLIPGWAMDYRIFSNLELNYNYLLPVKFDPFNFQKELLEFLNKKFIKKISLFGWSLGGFLAAEFALKNSKKVDKLILSGICTKFKRSVLEEVKLKLKKNKRAYLYKFYPQCFSADERQGLLWFKKHLLSSYIRSMQLKDLMNGLDYLMQAKIQPESLGGFKKIRIFQGEKDRITPFKCGLEIKSKLPKGKLICLAKTGHIPFLKPDFKEYF